MSHFNRLTVEFAVILIQNKETTKISDYKTMKSSHSYSIQITSSVTHRNFNAVKLWNNSIVKLVSLFLERTLKCKIINRNLCYMQEGIHRRNSPM